MVKKIFLIPYIANENFFTYAWEAVQYEIESLNNDILLLDFNENFNIPEYSRIVDDATRKHFFAEAKKKYNKKIQINVPSRSKTVIKKLDFETFNLLSVETQRSLNSVAATQIFNCENFGTFSEKYQKMQPYFESNLVTKEILEREIKYEKPSGVILFNGRWPDQVAILEVARKFKLSINFLEAGEPPTKRWFYEDFQTTNYEKFDQFLFNKYIAKIEADQWVGFASNWQIAHSTSRSVNKHLIIEPLVTQKQSPGKKRKIAIFTSSIDEYFSNLEFDHRGWESQELAIERIVSRLFDEDNEVVIRLHPNLGNKAWVDAVTIFESLGRTKAKIVLPWEMISSYKLIDESDIIITWGSTIGLESLFRKKKVLFLGPTIYESIIENANLNANQLETFDFDCIPAISDEKVNAAIYLSRNWGNIISENNMMADFVKSRTRTELLPNLFVKYFYFLKKITLIFFMFKKTSPNDLIVVLEKFFPRVLAIKIVTSILRLGVLRKRHEREFLIKR